jgi:uncharacterized protein (DUF58 family)
MNYLDRVTNWLEIHWVNPAYSGWLISGLGLFFFAAATNTMAGWLYVISGVMVAILVLAAVLPIQTLRGLRVQRTPIAPVSVGESLRLELLIENRTKRLKTLIQVLDALPHPLSPVRTVIEQISPQDSYRWVAELPTQQRGIYRWQTIQLRTAAPLGLFWCRRIRSLPAKAVVYPTVLSLSQCPLIDEMGQTGTLNGKYQADLDSEGMTRSLRPYRWGDSTRLIHWRSSARYGELRLRELETPMGRQELIVGLDSTSRWDRDCFEQAVVAAASLYFYGLQQQMSVSLWTAGSGIIRGEQSVLEVLAAIQFGEQGSPPDRPLLWLTQTAGSLMSLPTGSRWLLWQGQLAEQTSRSSFDSGAAAQYPGLVIQSGRPLQPQLQAALSQAATFK